MKQAGFTLIELMIGLVIAMLCMLMMLMLFKQITQIGLNAAQDAEYDAQIQTGLLVSQKFMQNAGYGSGLSNDIQIGTHYGHSAVFWRFIPDLGTTSIAYQCQGIAEKITTDGNTKLHQLILLKKTCGSDPANWKNGTWEEDQNIVAFRSSKSAPIFAYNITLGKCTPYGVDKNNSKGLRQMTITAKREHITGTGDSIKNTICLNNIHSE